MKLSLRARQVLLVGVIIFFVGIVTVVFVFFLSRGNPYGEEVIIKNYSENVQNLSPDYENMIMSSLYQTIKLNIPDGSTVPEVNDATIRDNTATQTPNGSENVYRGAFIVDMESIKQSYYVEYSYSKDPNNYALGGYPIIVTCLPVAELKYGDFNCRDSVIIESGEIDPIVALLPHSTINYEIRAITREDNSVRLSIQLLLSRADYNTREAEAVQEYKTEAINWMISKGYNPADYTIEYIY